MKTNTPVSQLISDHATLLRSTGSEKNYTRHYSTARSYCANVLSNLFLELSYKEETEICGKVSELLNQVMAARSQQQLYEIVLEVVDSLKALAKVAIDQEKNFSRHLHNVRLLED